MATGQYSISISTYTVFPETNTQYRSGRRTIETKYLVHLHKYEVKMICGAILRDKFIQTKEQNGS